MSCRACLTHVSDWLPGRCTGSRLWVHGFYKSKNTEKRSKNILYNEYGESELSSVMTNHNNSQLNKNTIFPYSSSFDPVSSPSNHLQKKHFLHHFLFRIRPFCEKWIILIYNSSYENFLEAGNSQNPLCWIRTTSQVAGGSSSGRLRRPANSDFRMS